MMQGLLPTLFCSLQGCPTPVQKPETCTQKKGSCYSRIVNVYSVLFGNKYSTHEISMKDDPDRYQWWECSRWSHIMPGDKWENEENSRRVSGKQGKLLAGRQNEPGAGGMRMFSSSPPWYPHPHTHNQTQVHHFVAAEGKVLFPQKCV